MAHTHPHRPASYIDNPNPCPSVYLAKSENDGSVCVKKNHTRAPTACNAPHAIARW